MQRKRPREAENSIALSFLELNQLIADADAQEQMKNSLKVELQEMKSKLREAQLARDQEEQAYNKAMKEKDQEKQQLEKENKALKQALNGI
jgi:hypothetical protein